MTTRYYRFNSPEVIAASLEYASSCERLIKQAGAIAAEFGGTAVYSTSVHGRGFAGLRFDPPIDSPLWTKPNKRYGNVQVPRSLPSAKAVREKWNSLVPREKPSTNALFKACGTDWGSLLFAGVGYTMEDDAFYMATSLDLTATGEEITGGRYDQAGKAVAA